MKQFKNKNSMKHKLVTVSSTDLIDSKVNLPNDLVHFEKILRSAKQFENQPLFNAVCYSCGMLLYGYISKGHKFNLNPQVKITINQQDVPVSKLYENLDLSFISKRGTWYSCIICKDGPKDPCPCYDPETGSMSIPQELSQLTNYEKSMISICGLFSTILKKANTSKRVWEHRVGETNILTKQEKHYFGMYGFLLNNSATQKHSESSHNKIVQALSWLRENNPIYQHFYSNFETMYRYDQKALSVTADNNITDKNGKPAVDQLHLEPTAICLPFSEEKNLPHLHGDTDIAGVQHPKNGILSATTYNDKDLEAKAWPNIFPYGTGSYHYSSSIKISQYVKMRLLNYDGRWRYDTNWSFFFFDRLIKQRILYANRARKTKIQIAKEMLNTGKVRELNSNKNTNPYAVYGTIVPHTIPGSKSYWSSKLLDLLAVSREFGTPSFFVTLTQNDNWPELQQHVKDERRRRKLNCSEPDPEHGYSCTEYSVAANIAFQQRFKAFKDMVFADKNGPLGHITNFWYRAEFQKRGAVHIHMVVWSDKIPEDAVSAEMPRSFNASNPSTLKSLRDIVDKYQQHGKCLPDRCFKGHGGKVLDCCKYGFPFKIQDEGLDDSGIRFNYQRRHAEDSRIVPYNLKIILQWQGHINVQKVTSGGWELYLAKYVAKAEPTFDMKLPESVTEPERYLRTRVAGRVEVDFTLLGCQLSHSSRDVVFLPTELKPSVAFLKRSEHFPQDNSSTDIFYDNLLQKYFDRPDTLKHLLYPDFVRRYKYKLGSNAQSDDSNDDIPQPKTTRTLCDKKGRILVKQKKGKEVIPRWRFIVPFGDDQEKFYEQKLILNIPITRSMADNILSPENETQTFTEECALRGMLEKTEDSMKVLQLAESQGYHLEKLKDIAQKLISSGWLDSHAADIFLNDIQEKRPAEMDEKEVLDVNDNAADTDLGDLQPNTTKIDLQQIKKTFSITQLKAFEWLEQHLAQEQVLACIVGPAGTGKSYLINAVVEMAKQCNIITQKLATTGVAAFLINGETVHHFFKMDITCNSYLEKGTAEFALVKSSNLIIIDEFSLLEQKVFYAINKLCQLIESSKKSHLPFGGKHIILVGDPAQLPAIDKDIFSTELWKKFNILVLKDVKRQKDDILVNILQNLRLGQLSVENKKILQEKIIPQDRTDDVCPPVIVSLREERDRWNMKFLDKLETEEVVIEAIDSDGNGNQISEAEKESIRKYHRERLPDVLHLKVGARVILLKNISILDGWVNGTLATIKSIKSDFIVLHHCSLKKKIVLGRMKQNLAFKDSTSALVRQQFPIQLGWALTVHKVQGMTLEKAFVDLSKSFFASGQAYVALSRVKKLENLHLINFCESAIILDPFYRELLRWMDNVDVLQNETPPKLPYPQKPAKQQEKEVSAKKNENQITNKRKLELENQNKAKIQKINITDEKQLQESTSKNTMTKHPPSSDTSIQSSPSLLQDMEPITMSLAKTKNVNIRQEHRIAHNIHPSILTHYEVIHTPGCGNCMWNSISTALFGSPVMMRLLRQSTFETISNNEEIFNHLITRYGLEGQTLESIKNSSISIGAWGDEFHLQALSMALNRPIYVYSTFRNSSGDFFLSSFTDTELQEAFENRADGTRQHLVYLPFNPAGRNRTPVMCFFGEHHYSAILLKSPQSNIFKPSQNLFQMVSIEE